MLQGWGAQCPPAIPVGPEPPQPPAAAQGMGWATPESLKDGLHLLCAFLHLAQKFV